LAWYNQSPARSGTPDSVRCARLNSGEQAALGRIWRRTTIIHRTVRWCTGLSGELTAASATVGRTIRGRCMARTNGRQRAPDCVRCTNCHGTATVIYTKLGRRSAPDTLSIPRLLVLTFTQSFIVLEIGALFELQTPHACFVCSSSHLCACLRCGFNSSVRCSSQPYSMLSL
jgi:hypothetical protein